MNSLCLSGPDPNIMAEVSFKMVYERMKDNKIEGQKEFPFHGTAMATAYESLKNKIKPYQRKALRRHGLFWSYQRKPSPICLTLKEGMSC